MSDSDLFRFTPTKKTVLYSYIKKPTINGMKVIKIEVYDAEKISTAEGDSKICDCEAELCVQHVVKNPFMDDVYLSIREIIAKLDGNMCSVL